MDVRSLESAQTGDRDSLHRLLVEKPFILKNNALFSSENPLHTASVAGHFVKEISRLKPEFAKEINQDGFSPMHMAAAIGYIEIVRELMRVDSRLCHLEGKDSSSPCSYQGKAYEAVELFLGQSGILEMKAKNNSGLTALDFLLIFPSEAGDKNYRNPLGCWSYASKRHQPGFHFFISICQSDLCKHRYYTRDVKQNNQNTWWITSSLGRVETLLVKLGVCCSLLQFW
ncbi:hypothetical protein GH714_025686 [Hevea brasiliensis]|uniref:Uncharacterized protein n=1 Tax=Hevea brasiliensis TaxID=3981 RepID=A0A6A6MDA9_HEVBR|nr:hypothetical protein GH714_025686 [Hevea brasiliensis]